MSSLPDRVRPRLTRPGRRWMATAARLAGRVTWRTLHPHLRERFLEAPRPAPLTRLYYRAVDGWQAPLLYLPPSPGGAGEPVMVVHGLGVGPDAFRYGEGPTLARRLTEAGFAVYLVTHRGDAEAVPPEGGRGLEAGFDEIVERDLPAAFRRILDHQDYPRVHLVGFGLGGQLALVLGARERGAATVVAAGAPVRFDRPRSHFRLAARAASLLPARWQLPFRVAARASSPFVEGAIAPAARATAGGRLRGVLTYASDDLHLGMLRQMMEWVEHGSLVSRGGVRDLVEELAAGRAPLLAVAGAEDTLGPVRHVRAAVERWGGADATCLEVPGYGHLDLLLGADADERVFQPVVRWLDARRRLAWEDGGSTVEVTAVGA